MNKPKTAKPRPEIVIAPGVLKTKPDPQMDRTIRETIESVIIAFVLAFLFRTFEAEAFVIPTGSMAPTLQGRHKDVDCAKCGYRVRASASDEDATAERINRGDFANPEQERRNSQVVAVTCPLCRYQTAIDPEKDGTDAPSFNGDRIIVAKFPYDFVEPKRWDIVVFKYPNDAKTNYIKRLVGLPRETVKIFHGNIYTQPEGGNEFQIERKPPDKQIAIAQMVYDNDYAVPSMTEAGWPARWQSWPTKSGGEKAPWNAGEDGKSFQIDSADANSTQWLRYQHFPPAQRDWKNIESGSIPPDQRPRPQLITDFYAYNNGIPRYRQHGGEADAMLGLNWVGDLLLETTVDVSSAQGQLLLDLVEGGVHFRASIDVVTGEATLSIDGDPAFQPKAATSVKGPGNYRLTLANFDDQLTLWVNGSPVQFDKPTTYGPLDNDQPKSTPEDAGDLAPAGIGAAGGLSARVEHLQLKRDIYYIADRYDIHERGALTEYRSGGALPSMRGEDWARFLSTPAEWRRTGSDGLNAFELRSSVEFPLAVDQFFVLGDNSPASKDSRLWENDHHYVEREMMIGEALFIYWPHGLNYIPGTRIPFFGMFPNLKDMGFVR